MITTIRREHCGNGINCPALHRRENGRMIVSGPTVTDPDTLHELGLPDHESAVEVTAQLLSGAGLTLLGINDLTGLRPSPTSRAVVGFGLAGSGRVG